MSDSQNNPSSIIYSEDTSEYDRNKESVASEQHLQANNDSLTVEMVENGHLQHEVNGHNGSLYIMKKDYLEKQVVEQQTNQHTIEKEAKYGGELISYSPVTSQISANKSTIAVLAKHVEIFNNVQVSSLMQYDQGQQVRQTSTQILQVKVEQENDKVEYSDDEYYRESYTSNTLVNSGIKKEEKSQILQDKVKAPLMDTNSNRYQSEGSSEDQREQEEKQQRLKQQQEVSKGKQIIHVEYTQKREEINPDTKLTNASPQDPTQLLINQTKNKDTFKRQSQHNHSQYIEQVNQSRSYHHNPEPGQSHQEQINQSKYSEGQRLDILANLKVVPVGISEYSQKQVQRKLFKSQLDKESLLIISKKQDQYVPIEPSPSQSLRHQPMRIPKTQTKPVSQIQQQTQGNKGGHCKCEIM